MIDYITVAYYSLMLLGTALLGNLFWKIKSTKFKPKLAGQIIVFVTRIVMALPFSLMCAWRDYSVGYDTNNYLNSFQRIFNDNYSADIFMVGYHSLVKILEAGGERLVFFGMSIIVFVTIIYAFEQIIKRKNDFILVLTCCYLYILPRIMDQQRQMIAVGFLVLALSFYLCEMNKKALVCILCGAIFHSSILVFLIIVLIIYFCWRKKIDKWKVDVFVIMIGTILTVTINRYMNIIYALLPTHYQYLQSQMREGSRFGLGGALDLLPIVYCLVIYFLFGTKEKIKYEILVVELITMSAIVFRVMGYSTYFIHRLFYYGANSSLLLYAFSINNIKRNVRWICNMGLLIIMVIYFTLFYLVYKTNGIVPYRLGI